MEIVAGKSIDVHAQSVFSRHLDSLCGSPDVPNQHPSRKEQLRGERAKGGGLFPGSVRGRFMAPRRSCSFFSSLKINIQCPVVFTVPESELRLLNCTNKGLLLLRTVYLP